METTNQLLNNSTVLSDRVLCYDGSTIVSPDKIIDFIGLVDKLFTTEMSPDIDEYNKSSLKSAQIGLKTTVDDYNTNYRIPEKYSNMSITKYVIKLFLAESDHTNLSVDEFNSRVAVIDHEIKLYKQHELFPMLKTLVYVIDVFRQNNIVWGLGRGSSVSSYVLYLLGVHDIDSVKYELDINEFIR